MFRRGILILAAIGLGILIAPHDGKTSRRKLSDKLMSIKDKAYKKLRRK